MVIVGMLVAAVVIIALRNFDVLYDRFFGRGR